MSNYLRDLMDGMDSLNWDPYQSDHEDANGQYEVNFTYADALKTADRYTFFKMMSSQYAKKYGAIATHMAKPFSDKTGSGGHIHFHLADAKTGKNLFLDNDDPRGLGLSTMAYNFIGGILDHAQALCAINSPTVNCYKRLQIGSGLLSTSSGHTWTPAFLSYGDNNRTQMIRTAGPGHLEDRTVSAALLFHRSTFSLSFHTGILPRRLFQLLSTLMIKDSIKTRIIKKTTKFVILHYFLCGPYGVKKIFLSTYKTLDKEDNHTCYNLRAKV